MRIAITGGSGFLSGRLAEDLSQKGHSVQVFTRKHDPKNTIARERIVNWSSEESLSHICNKSDVVIHAAGINAKDSNDNPLLANEVNGGNTTKLALLASTFGVKKFIYISTAHVYKNESVGVFTEESIPQNNSPYATSHLIGEHGVLELDGLNGMRSIVVRVGNVYGAPANNNTSCLNLAVNNFYYQALTQHRITIQSNSKTERNFLSATDFCSTFNQIINLERMNGFRLFNVGALNSRSLLEMAKLVTFDTGFRIGKSIEVTEINRTENSDLKFDLNTDRLQGLGISTKDNFKEEFDRLYAYFSEKISSR